ncbi:unnamed protein product [Durusdinium trenchii]|uniref:Ubiquitin-like domain-containing protein n=1 Tax=Durusdinium trenchii TaxID=1381693 RepID=A0ABP0SIJ3_9DINO
MTQGTSGVLGFSSASFWRSALFLAQGAVPHVDVAWSAVLSSCEASAEWEMALASLERAFEHHLEVSLVLNNAAISAISAGATAVTASTWQVGVERLLLAASRQLRVDVIGYNALCSAQEKSCVWHQVLSLASQLAARSLRTDAFAAGAVFFASKEAVGGRTWQRTLRLADWVAERQVELDVIKQQAVLAALATRGQALKDGCERLSGSAVSLLESLPKRETCFLETPADESLGSLDERPATRSTGERRQELGALSLVAKGCALSGALGRHPIYGRVAHDAALALEDIALALSLLGPWDAQPGKLSPVRAGIDKAVQRFRQALVPPGLDRSVQSTQAGIGQGQSAVPPQLGTVAVYCEGKHDECEVFRRRNGENKENQELLERDDWGGAFEHDKHWLAEDTFYISVDASVASVAVVDGHSLSVAVVLDAVGEILSAAGRDALADLLRRMKSCSAEELAQVGTLTVIGFGGRLVKADPTSDWEETAVGDTDAQAFCSKLNRRGRASWSATQKPTQQGEGATLLETLGITDARRCLSAGDLAVDVSLPSGRSCRVNVSASSVVADLRLVAEKALNVGFLRLISPDGRFLDPALSLCQSGLQSGDTLTAVAQPAKIQATCSAFAKWCSGPSPVTLWGDPDCGGENNEELVEVQEIQSAHEAFAAILGDGTVKVWGNPDSGGDAEEVAGKLKNVQQIQSAHSAFAALLADGSVVTWGDSSFGGDSSRVQRRLKKVKHIQSTGWAFAALLEDGSVVTWGDSKDGGDSSKVQRHLKNVRAIQSTDAAFAALLADGSVVTWGLEDYGGNSQKVQAQLRSVTAIQATEWSFAALRQDGQVVSWGHITNGGDSSEVALSEVQMIQATAYAFAAISTGGRVTTWGHPLYGGDSGAVQGQLSKGVVQIQATERAFCAILEDGSVVTWGHKDYGGEVSADLKKELCHVHQVQSTKAAFAAILADGRVVAWGSSTYGGEITKEQEKKIRNVQLIQSSHMAFAALLSDGSVESWGKIDDDDFLGQGSMSEYSDGSSL